MFAPQVANAPTKAAARPVVAPAERRVVAAPSPWLGNQATLRRYATGRTTGQPATAQSGLLIGAIDDPLEHDADAVAARVMGMADASPAVSAGPAALNRKCADCEEEAASGAVQRKSAAAVSGGVAPAAVHATLAAPAQPLGAAERAWFEPRFGYDFGGVRIHHDSRAAASARAVDALAYTVGRDIVFGPGQYAPDTLAGRSLLAHELAHVVQQAGGVAGTVAALQRDPDPAATGTGGTGTGATGASGTGASGTGTGGAGTGGTGTGGAPSGTSSTARTLTSAEHDAAAFVFGGGLNLAPIQIEESSTMTVGGYIRTVPDKIYVPPGHKISLPLLMHELTHCAQYQHGVPRDVTLLTAIFGSYDYGGEQGLLDAIKTKKCFDHFNTEQQGDIVQNYYEKVVAGGSTYPWSVFINQVRAGGACIWSTPSQPAPAPAPGNSATA